MVRLSLPPEPAQGWQIALAAMLLVALASVPLFSTALPPLVDYPNHLARFWLLTTGGSRFYAVRWAALPNLAGDLVVPLLARLVPLPLAGKIFIAAGFALTVGGTIWLHRLAVGEWRRWPLLAGALLYNRQLLWGFVNYLFGLGLALCGAALWLALERRAAWQRIAISAPAALACWLAHIAAFGLYALIIAGLEAAPALAEFRAGDRRALLRRSAIAGAQFVTPAVLLVRWWPGAAHRGFHYALDLSRKPDLLFSVFDNYSRPFDIACFALLVILFGVLLWRRRLRIAPRLVVPLALVAAAYVLLPSQMLSGSGADHRVVPALFALLFAATAPQWPSRRMAVLAMAAVALALAARLAAVEAVWLKADRVYAADLSAIDALPAGSLLAVAFPASAVSAGGIPQIHVPTLAVWRRGAFVPTLFAYPAQQPIALKPPYDRLANATSGSLLWRGIVEGRAAARRRAGPSLEKYDFVAFVDRAPFRVPAQPCLRPFALRPGLQIFAVVHSTRCGGS